MEEWESRDSIGCCFGEMAELVAILMREALVLLFGVVGGGSVLWGRG